MGNLRNKYLFKNTLIFTIGSITTKLIAFFLIPLYTYQLTTSEYGIIDLVVTISAVSVPVLTLNITESVMRFGLDSNADQDKITKIGMTVLSGTVIFGTILIPICNLFPILEGKGLLVYLYCVSTAACQLFLYALRGKELLVYYCFGNILHALIIAILNLVFLLCLHAGVSGYLSANIISNFIVAAFALYMGKGYKSLKAKIDLRVMKEMTKYSVVLIPNSLMWWIMNSSDHLMVANMIGIDANGLYSISYKFPTLIATVTGIFNQAWSYSAIREENSDDITEYTNKVFRSMTAIIMLVGLFMMTVIKPFLKIYVSSDYYSAWKYTPFLIIGCVFLTLASFMSASYAVHKDSKGFLMSSSLGAFLNVILNFILIPAIGIYGAALATCASYIGVFVFRVFHTRKYMYYRVLTREFFTGIIGLTISSVLMFFDNKAFLLQVLILLLVAFLFRNYWSQYVLLLVKKIKKRIKKLK